MIGLLYMMLTLLVVVIPSDGDDNSDGDTSVNGRAGAAGLVG